MPHDRLRAPCLCLVPTMIARPPVDELQRSCFSCSNQALLHGPPRWPFDPVSRPSVYAKIGCTGQRRLSGRQIRMAFEKQRRRNVMKHRAFVMGHEALGPSFTADQYPDMILIRIPMYGQVESLHVSVAASIVMYEYVRQHGQ